MQKIIFPLLLCVSCNWKEEVPKDFNFSFSFDNTEKINTFDSTYTRKYIFHDKIVELILTNQEKQEIYSVMLESRIMTMPDKFEFNSDKNEPCIIPYTVDYLEIRMNGKTKKIEYSYRCKPKNKKISAKYLKMINKILNIIQSKKEIKNLPESDMMFM